MAVKVIHVIKLVMRQFSTDENPACAGSQQKPSVAHHTPIKLFLLLYRPHEKTFHTQQRPHTHTEIFCSLVFSDQAPPDKIREGGLKFIIKLLVYRLF